MNRCPMFKDVGWGDAAVFIPVFFFLFFLLPFCREFFVSPARPSFGFSIVLWLFFFSYFGCGVLYCYSFIS